MNLPVVNGRTHLAIDYLFQVTEHDTEGVTIEAIFRCSTAVEGVVDKPN